MAYSDLDILVHRGVAASFRAAKYCVEIMYTPPGPALIAAELTHLANELHKVAGEIRHMIEIGEPGPSLRMPGPPTNLRASSPQSASGAPGRNPKSAIGGKVRP